MRRIYGPKLPALLLLGAACGDPRGGSQLGPASMAGAGVATGGSAAGSGASGGALEVAASGGALAAGLADPRGEAGSAPEGGLPPTGAAGGASAGESALSVEPDALLWTAVRYYSGATPSGRTSGPAQGPHEQLTLHNGGAGELSVQLLLSGPDAARFELTTPEELVLAAGADADVDLELVTDSAQLGPVPAQDDGSTVLQASLSLRAGSAELQVRSYALVLSYVELEPTFGQILRAFPQWTSKLPSWLENDANPNPGSPLPGVVPGTDEAAAPSFVRLDATRPVTLRPLARFSPPGAVPFGWYEPGKLGARTTLASLAKSSDPNTNDKSRMLEPPLASGVTSFEPAARPFGIWMEPAMVGLLTSDDASCFDGQHRVRAWALRDARGEILPGEFLIGAEEANNGDYQDYVFELSNVRPSP